LVFLLSNHLDFDFLLRQILIDSKDINFWLDYFLLSFFFYFLGLLLFPKLFGFVLLLGDDGINMCDRMELWKDVLVVRLALC
jgi:hypothetical protein